MKGYMDLLFGFFFMLITFVLVNYYLGVRLNDEVGVSDIAGETYKMIDAIEFAKINSQQSLKFAVLKTEKELQLNPSDVQRNNQLQTIFLDRLKKNYNPSLDYSDVDVSVTVMSLSVDGNQIVANNYFISSTESRQASLVANVATPLS